MPSPLMLTGTAVKSFPLGQHWLTLNIEHWLISTNQDLRGRIAFEVLARIGVQLTASCWESNGRALFGPLWNSCCHIIWIKLLLEFSIYHETDACMSVCATSQSDLNVFCVPALSSSKGLNGLHLCAWHFVPLPCVHINDTWYFWSPIKYAPWWRCADGVGRDGGFGGRTGFKGDLPLVWSGRPSAVWWGVCPE